jgi:hypothetical protein
MIKEVEIKVWPDKINDEDHIKKLVAERLKLLPTQDFNFEIVKRSIDARKKRPFYLLRVSTSVGDKIVKPKVKFNFPTINNRKEVIIVGAGPAGYFAALKCLELGMKPIVIDRGKDVQARRRDLRAIQQFDEVNPHSNYCFGEGGAGTYSDGKLYTRSHKRGSIEEILQLLVFHGADSDILIDAHPHIGSNKLPKIIANIRETIINNGGEVLFETFITDFIIQDKKIKGVISSEGKEFFSESVILATGHSARDIYYLLHKKEIKIEEKDFALGVRIEHPQSLIDELQYNQKTREENLPAASYKVVCQIEQQGVFSFCMCPGGLIVPSATSPGEIVVNGMSLSRRDSPFANSGFVTSVSTEYLKSLGYKGVFSNLEFQQSVEQSLFNHGDGSQKAPTLRMTDFVNKRMSNTLNDCSYIPGIYAAPLYELLPTFIYDRLSKGMVEIGNKMRGFYTENANVVAVESRTSSPIRIPRDKISYMHTEVEGLYPCGEGAGYAGGILSAAMDGQNVVKAIAAFVK